MKKTAEIKKEHPHRNTEEAKDYKGSRKDASRNESETSELFQKFFDF